MNAVILSVFALQEIKGRPITHIVQEIASSEKTFVDVLRLLNEVCKHVMSSQQS